MVHCRLVPYGYDSDGAVCDIICLSSQAEVPIITRKESIMMTITGPQWLVPISMKRGRYLRLRWRWPILDDIIFRGRPLISILIVTLILNMILKMFVALYKVLLGCFREEFQDGNIFWATLSKGEITRICLTYSNYNYPHYLELLDKTRATALVLQSISIHQ